MIKKVKKDAPDVQSSERAQAVRDSAQQIWLAGLGAFAKAQAEGSKVFEKLVREGRSLHTATRDASDDGFAAGFAQTVQRVSNEVGKQAQGTWDKLESVFEDRVARALAALGVPTRDEVRALTERVEHLTAAVEALARRTSAPPARRAAARPAAGRATARKKTTAKKPRTT